MAKIAKQVISACHKKGKNQTDREVIEAKLADTPTIQLYYQAMEFDGADIQIREGLTAVIAANIEAGLMGGEGIYAKPFVKKEEPIPKPSKPKAAKPKKEDKPAPAVEVEPTVEEEEENDQFVFGDFDEDGGSISYDADDTVIQ